MYIVVLCTTPISGIYIGFTAKIEAASSKKEVKRVEESVAEEVTVATLLKHPCSFNKTLPK